jgi:hypothetical protein
LNYFSRTLFRLASHTNALMSSLSLSRLFSRQCNFISGPAAASHSISSFGWVAAAAKNEFIASDGKASFAAAAARGTHEITARRHEET